MELILYNISIFLYEFAIRIASLWNSKAKKWVFGRKNLLQKIENDFLASDTLKNKRIWFHCASLGEFEQARPVIELIKKDNSNTDIILTFFSPSGFEIRKNYPLAKFVYFLPSDTKYNAMKFISLINPTIAVFVKYEFWHHYLITLKEKKIPVFLISAIFTRDQIFFRWYGVLFKKMLSAFTHIFVQNETSLKVLNDHSFTHVTVTGDTRFDRVRILAKENFPEENKIEKFIGASPVLVAGSIWEKDLTILAPLINQFAHPLKIIIAPHEVDEKHVVKIERMLNKPIIRYSKFRDMENYEEQVIILDTIGLLGKIYRFATMAYVGGAFGKGLHNILEPAVYGTPVIFGPNYKRFPEAAEMIERGTGFSVSNYSEFSDTFMKLYNDTSLRDNIFQEQIKYMEKNCGAAERVWNQIKITTNHTP